MSYVYNPFTGTLDRIGQGGTSGPPTSIDDNVFVEVRQLSATEATNQQLTLTNTPTDADKVVLDIVGGTSQVPGSDFEVTGTILNWNGFALETLLEQDDVIRITYFV